MWKKIHLVLKIHVISTINISMTIVNDIVVTTVKKWKQGHKFIFNYRMLDKFLYHYYCYLKNFYRAM